MRLQAADPPTASHMGENLPVAPEAQRAAGGPCADVRCAVSITERADRPRSRRADHPRRAGQPSDRHRGVRGGPAERSVSGIGGRGLVSRDRGILNMPRGRRAGRAQGPGWETYPRGVRSTGRTKQRRRDADTSGSSYAEIESQVTGDAARANDGVLPVAGQTHSLALANAELSSVPASHAGHSSIAHPPRLCGRAAHICSNEMFDGARPRTPPGTWHQWWKSRSPVKTITIPCSSQAWITSRSRTEPPG